MISICDYIFLKVSYNLLSIFCYFSGKQTEENYENAANEPRNENIAGCLIALLSLAGSMRSIV